MSHDRTLSTPDPMNDPSSVPESVILVRDRSRLRLVWPNGEKSEIDAGRLRRACRCAGCTRARIDGAFPGSFDGLSIKAIGVIGDYAINIVFADGHARGIYPWEFLRSLALQDDLAIPERSNDPLQDALHDGPSA
jgi:prepilin-type processing-associated H-X9-DG protein